MSSFSPIFFQGELQYFIGVQLDGSEYVEPVRHRLSDNTEKKSAKLVRGLEFYSSISLATDSGSRMIITTL